MTRPSEDIAVQNFPSSGPHGDQIEELRRRLSKTLQKYPAYNTDFSLQRWLQYYRYDVDAAAPKMESALNIIGTLGAFDYKFDTFEDVRDVIKNSIPSADYFPGGLMGRDKHGNVVSVQPMGRLRPKNVISTGRVSDFYRLSILECEASMALLRKEEEKLGRPLSVILISDIADFSTSAVFMSAIKVYMNSLNYLQMLFPESISRIYVINAPAAVNFIYQMAKLILSKKIITKVQFLGQNWREVLKEELGEGNVLPFWGGNKAADSPTGLIRMGGEMPEDFKSEIVQRLKFVPEEELTQLKVSARSAATVPVEVKCANSKLSWYFTLASGDVDFWISFKEEIVWPRFRISTEFVAEYGDITCREAGTYVLHFDNCHSTFRSKQVAYSAEVTEGKVSEDVSGGGIPTRAQGTNSDECD